ncbi:SPOSA6832_04915, partial [Sporobolomyces salmonicolor]
MASTGPSTSASPPSPVAGGSSGDAPPPLTSVGAEVATAPTDQRVSFYVQAADDMIEAVLKHEAFLFSEREQLALRRFQLLESDQSRYLFMRLFLRKHGWIRLSGIGYENDVSDLPAACEALWRVIELTPTKEREEEVKPPVAGPSTPLQPQPPPAADPGMIDLTMSDDEDEKEEQTKPLPKKLGEVDKEQEADLSRIAEDKEVLANEDPESALGLLSLDELIALGKRMKVAVPAGRGTRGEWTKALLRTSRQSTLSFFSVPQNGPVIRLSPAYITLFNRLSLVYHRTSYTATSSQPSKTSSLTASLLARFGKRRYPTYTVSRSFAIFPSRLVLKQFESAMEIERRVEEALDGVWGAGVTARKEKETPEEKRARFREGIRVWEGVEEEWKTLCVEAEREMRDEEDDGAKRRLYYRRRFHPGWPLSRAAYKAAACYAKLGDHDREVSILRFLLSQTSFRRGKRGDWHDRLALVLMNYPLGEERESCIMAKKKERLARERKEEALRGCERGLEDPFTHLIYKSSLQRRIARIESALGIPKDERCTFEVLLAKPQQRVMEGERLDEPTIGRKSVWRASDGEEVSVEELALEQYTTHDHHVQFALIFWDIIFAPVDGVFETAFQSAPLDLATDAFAIVRRPAITARLEAIERGDAVKFLKETDDRERPLGTWAVGINWEKFGQEDLVEIVELAHVSAPVCLQCTGGPALASILTMFVEEYGHRTGGIPDLCLWNPTTATVLFSEIKGPGDKLSETQKVWIDVLLSAGVGVEVCRVVTSEEMRAGEDDDDEDADDGGDRKKRPRGKSKGGGNARARSRSTSTMSMKRAKTEEAALDRD